MEDVVKVLPEQCESVYTLNTWTDAKKQEIREKLEAGYYVFLGCTAIGHTLSQMVESGGIKWVKEEYGDKVEVVYTESEIFSFNPKVHLIGKKKGN